MHALYLYTKRFKNIVVDTCSPQFAPSSYPDAHQVEVSRTAKAEAILKRPSFAQQAAQYLRAGYRSNDLALESMQGSAVLRGRFPPPVVSSRAARHQQLLDADDR